MTNGNHPDDRSLSSAPTNRRTFLQASVAAAAAAGLSAAAPAREPESAPATRPAPAKRPLKLLILGGTGFLGPHIVNMALARGHEMTLFNRGRTNPHLFPDLEKLRGDRDGDLGALEGRNWDAVIDTSGYVPRLVRASAGLLADHVRQYVFISSVSVYADHGIPHQDETGAVGTLEDETVEQVTGETYGPLKALCEQAAEASLPGRTMTIRPGLIVGPGDPTDRFTYWPVRIDRGGDVLAPGDGTDPVQIIDARDLAMWTITAIETGRTGVYNATSPAGRFTMAEVLHGCKAAMSTDATFTWADAEFLGEHEVQPWADMPIWVPPTDGYEGFGLSSVTKAVAAGLTFRPLAETAADTLAWYRERSPERRARLRAGLTAEREAEVLEAWRTREM